MPDEKRVGAEAAARSDDRVAAFAVQGLTKRFGGQLALDDVTFDVRRGSIHGLVGENGAGKSTLIKLLAGVHRPDGGELLVDGRPAELHAPRDARALGFGFLHQHLDLVPAMTVRENLLLTAGYPRRAGLAVDWSRVDRDARRHLHAVGLELDPRERAADLSPAVQQLVCLARVLLERPQVIVLDEPTASLGATDAAHLLELVLAQRERGATVVYVSHRLDEILRICDTVTVLRDGRHVASVEAGGALDRPTLVHLLGGAAEEEPPHHAQAPARHAGAPPALALEELASRALDRPATLSVARGEVVGLAGLVGSGRSTLLRMVGGGIRPTGGRLRIDGVPVSLRSRDAARDRGLALVHAPRQEALVPDFGIDENISLGHVERRYAWRRLILRKRRERRGAARHVERLGIKRAKGDDRVRLLSGGNQQKVVLARALDVEPRILLLDEPTHGVDIATKQAVYQLVRELAAGGMAVLVVSSELEELPLMCDRILAFRKGEVIAELPGATTRAQIVRALFAEEEETR